MKKIRPTLILATLWFILSVVLLTLPGSDFPTEDWFGKIWLDKWIHIGMFSILVWLICWGTLGWNLPLEKRKRVFLLIAASCLLYGIAMEFVQKYFIPNRSFDLKDIVADGIGCVIGCLYSVRRYIKK